LLLNKSFVLPHNNASDINQAFKYNESALIVDNEIMENSLFSNTTISSSPDKFSDKMYIIEQIKMTFSLKKKLDDFLIENLNFLYNLNPQNKSESLNSLK
jgi:hypothetical protein